MLNCPFSSYTREGVQLHHLVGAILRRNSFRRASVERRFDRLQLRRRQLHARLMFEPAEEAIETLAEKQR